LKSWKRTYFFFQLTAGEKTRIAEEELKKQVESEKTNINQEGDHNEEVCFIIYFFT